SAHPLSSFAVAERVYIDGKLYHDMEADARRITEIKKEKERLRGNAEATPEKPKSAQKTQGQLEPWQEDGLGHGPMVSAAAEAPAYGTQAQASQPVPTPPGSPSNDEVLAITNARIVPVTNPTIEKGTIVIRGNKIVAL